MLVACNMGATAGESLSSSSSSSQGASGRPELSTVLERFDRGGRVNVQYLFLAADLDESGATPTYSTPSLGFEYAENGMYWESDLDSGWPASIAGHGGGYLSLSEGEVSGLDAGVYRMSSTYTEWTVTTTPDTSEGSDSSSSVEPIVEEFDAFLFDTPVKTTITDLYAEIETPQKLADNASTLAADFGRGSSSNISLCTVESTIETFARSMNVDSVVKSVMPNFVYSQLQVNYTRSSTSYIYDFFGYEDAAHSDSAVLGGGFNVARAILIPQANHEIEAYSSFIAGELPSLGEVNQEVAQ